jgi:hypothetical protein
MVERPRPKGDQDPLGFGIRRHQVHRRERWGPRGAAKAAAPEEELGRWRKVARRRRPFHLYRRRQANDVDPQAWLSDTGPADDTTRNPWMSNNKTNPVCDQGHGVAEEPIGRPRADLDRHGAM